MPGRAAVVTSWLRELLPTARRMALMSELFPAFWAPTYRHVFLSLGKSLANLTKLRKTWQNTPPDTPPGIFLKSLEIWRSPLPLLSWPGQLHKVLQHLADLKQNSPPQTSPMSPDIFFEPLSSLTFTANMAELGRTYHPDVSPEP